MLKLNGLALLITALGSLSISKGSYAVTLTPPNLEQGTQYRLIFATSENIVGTHADVDIYNNFVNTLVNDSTYVPDSIKDNSWTAVLSTREVDAIDNTSTQLSIPIEEQVPIFAIRRPGEAARKVADNYADFWDGFWSSTVNFSELGGSPAPRSGAFPIGGLVWTGTNSDGTASSRPLGAQASGFVSVGSQFGRSGPFIGRSNNIDNGDTIRASSQLAIFGLSGKITAGDIPTPSVPEPTTFLGSLTLIGLGAVLKYKLRSPT